METDDQIVFIDQYCTPFRVQYKGKLLLGQNGQSKPNLVSHSETAWPQDRCAIMVCKPEAQASGGMLPGNF